METDKRVDSEEIYEGGVLVFIERMVHSVYVAEKFKKSP